MSRVRVKWYCGHYTGEPKWHGTDVEEPDDCETEFETEEQLCEWEQNCCTATCPNCGAELTQDMDVPTVLEVLGRVQMAKPEIDLIEPELEDTIKEYDKQIEKEMSYEQSRD